MSDVRLGDSDRERLGCEEWLPFSLADITIADLDELSERFGFDVNDWPQPLMGEITLEDAGQEGVEPKLPPWHIRGIVWMALRQNGHAVSWDEAGTVKPMRVLLRSSSAEPGKDDPESSPSETSDASTTTPSESSST